MYCSHAQARHHPRDSPREKFLGTHTFLGLIPMPKLSMLPKVPTSPLAMITVVDPKRGCFGIPSISTVVV